MERGERREEVIVSDVEPVDDMEVVEEVIEVVNEYEPECNMIEGTCGEEVILVDDNPYE